MSQFVQNRATRMGKRSVTEAYRTQQAIEASHIPTQDAPLAKLANKKVTYRTELQDTIIGSPNSKGLVIAGGLRQLDSNHAYNPDGRTDVVLGELGDQGGFPDGTRANTAVYPPFPVRYSGPGYMSFVDPVNIPTLLGKTTIQGDLVVQGGITQGPGGGAVDLNVPFVIVNDADVPFDTQSSSVVAKDLNVGDLVYINARISWTSKGAAGGGTGPVSIIGNTIDFVPFRVVAHAQGFNGSQYGSNTVAGNTVSPERFDILEMKPNGSAPEHIPNNRFKEAGTVWFSGLFEKA